MCSLALAVLGQKYAVRQKMTPLVVIYLPLNTIFDRSKYET
jgi:hypothetical protein